MLWLADKLEYGHVGVTKDLVAAHMWANIYYSSTDGAHRYLRAIEEKL